MFKEKRARSFVFLYLILCAFFLSAASLQAQTNPSTAENILVSNRDHFISYRIEGKNVTFTMESISDFVNDFDREFPNTDFFSVAVDVNRNGAIDKNIDVDYGIRSNWMRTSFVDRLYRFIFRKNPICTQYLLANGISTTCGWFKSKASLKQRFAGSKNQRGEHPIFIFTIPRSELNQGGTKANVLFDCYSSGRGYTVYPVTTDIDHQKIFTSFRETIEIDL